MLLGTPIEGVWHTGVVLDGREEVFFGYGIQRTRAGTTMFGQPHHIIDVGTSEVDPAMLNELLADISPRFRPQDYSLLTHNCNHFSNELVQLLTGESVPDYIISQAQVIFNTPFGESIMPMVMAMEGLTSRATASGLVQHAPAMAAAAAANTAATGAASSSAAAAAAGVAAAEEQAAAAAQRAAAAGDAAAAAAGSAAANAGMAAAARAAQAAAAAEAAGGSGLAGLASPAGHSSSDQPVAEQQQQQQPGGSGSSSRGGSQAAAGHGAAGSTATVGKVTDGVAALDIAADGRAAAQ